jgi:hypothetical protein
VLYWWCASGLSRFYCVKSLYGPWLGTSAVVGPSAFRQPCELRTTTSPMTHVAEREPADLRHLREGAREKVTLTLPLAARGALRWVVGSCGWGWRSGYEKSGWGWRPPSCSTVGPSALGWTERRRRSRRSRWWRGPTSTRPRPAVAAGLVAMASPRAGLQRRLPEPGTPRGRGLAIILVGALVVRFQYAWLV